MSLAFAFLLALGPALHAESPQPQASTPTDDPDYLRGQMSSAKQKLEPLIRRLGELDYSDCKKSFSTGSGPEMNVVQKERARLRRELETGRAGLNQLNDRFRVLSFMHTASQVQNFFPGNKDARSKNKLAENLAMAMGNDSVYHASTSFDGQLVRSMKDDEARFGRAREVCERRRVSRLAAMLLLAAILSAAAILFVLRRKSQRSKTASPTLSPAAVTGPPMAAPTISPGATVPPAGLSAPARMTLAASSIGPGAVIGGNLQIVRELGRGGMGLVYEALDLTLQRKAVLKKLREELLESPKELEAFLSQARLVASLKHPSIAEIHGVVREGGQIFLVFEHVSGRPLNRVLEEHGKLPLSAIHALLFHAGGALDYAHSQKVLHGGLKPSNIMITEDNRVKVMDFGLAHQAQTTAARLTKTKPGGTTAYMAPEQELGTVSREGDLYSLSACVYEMAVGRPPFSGPDFLAQKREMRCIPPSQAAGLPPAFDAFMQKALQPQPALRYRTAAEITAAIGALAKV